MKPCNLVDKVLSTALEGLLFLKTILKNTDLRTSHFRFT
jgi:hypothetical protein